jgi:hypothetical protein
LLGHYLLQLQSNCFLSMYLYSLLSILVHQMYLKVYPFLLDFSIFRIKVFEMFPIDSLNFIVICCVIFFFSPLIVLTWIFLLFLLFVWIRVCQSYLSFQRTNFLFHCFFVSFVSLHFINFCLDLYLFLSVY